MVWEDCVTTMQYLAFSPSQVRTYFQLINFDIVTAKQIVKFGSKLDLSSAAFDKANVVTPVFKVTGD